MSLKMLTVVSSGINKNTRVFFVPNSLFFIYIKRYSELLFSYLHNFRVALSPTGKVIPLWSLVLHCIYTTDHAT